MRKFVVLLLGTSMLFLTSCFDIIEEVYLNKDGSGKYITTIDASGLFSNPFMKSALEEAAKEEGGEDTELEQDSIIYYKDMAGYADLTADEQAKVKDLNMRITMSESKEEFIIVNKIPFNSLTELEEISTILGKIQSEDDGGGLFSGANPFGSTTPQFKQGKRELIRLPDAPSDDEDMDDETMDMARMFLADAKMTTIYHLPGKIKKCDIPNAVIDGKMVKVENSLLEMMDEKVSQAGSIKYKRK
jgi:hypothetical protein